MNGPCRQRLLPVAIWGRRMGMGLCLALMLGTSAVVHAAGVSAEPAALAPIEAYVGPAEHSQPRLSPDGRLLATLSPLGGKRNLVVIDIDTMQARPVTSISSFDVVDYHWVGSGWLVFTLGALDTPSGVDGSFGAGLFAIKADGTGLRRLQPTYEEQRRSGQATYRHLDFMAAVPGSDHEILASGNLEGRHDSVYRIDLENGRKRLLTERHPGFVARWLLDLDGVPRLAVVHSGEDVPETELITSIMLRDSAEAPWREIGRFGHQDKGRWTPRAFAADNRDLIVTASADRATSAFYRFDVERGALAELLAGHPRYDASEAGLLRDGTSRAVTGLAYRDDRYQSVDFDTESARLQGLMEAQFKGMAVRVQRAAQGRALVAVWSDRQPASYYLFDESRRQLRFLLKSRPQIDERQLVEMRPFLLKTRDGLEIPSYYFLPRNHRPGQRLPTVVHIHGGPHMRADHWGALETHGVREAQLLASRGYAVVLPNFRITPGLGRRIYNAGIGELGRRMSDDHEDAARWAVEQGFADPQRLCIAGASYGGYATLWASIRSAELFRCGVAGAPVTDLRELLTSTATDFTASDAAVAGWRRLIGLNKQGDWRGADAVSPARHAERSGFALFIWAGGADRRTPIKQTELMVDALTRAGRPPERLLIRNEEGHGFGRLENRVELYRQMLEFLDRHIGAGAGAGAPAAAAAAASGAGGAQ